MSGQPSPITTATKPGTTRRTNYVLDCAGAWITVRARSQATVLRVDGDVDACNAHAFYTAIKHYAVLHVPIIADLTALDFVSVAGFRALLTLREDYAKAAVPFIVIPGTALQVLCRVFPDHLNTEASISAALHHLTEVKRARRQVLLSKIPSNRTSVANLAPRT